MLDEGIISWSYSVSKIAVV